MIGAIVFVLAFFLFLLISFVIPLPPGATIVEMYTPDLVGTSYECVVWGIINGIVYGIMIWIIFSVAKMLYDRIQGSKEVTVKVETKD